MSSQRPSFAKRDRETRLKDRARQKAERRAQRKSQPRDGAGGPPIATAEEMRALSVEAMSPTLEPPKPST